MSPLPSRRAALAPERAPVPVPPDSITAQLSALYEVAQKNVHVFASPLGLFESGSGPGHLPRFVFFGPHATDESWRLAFLAGFDRRELRASRALLQLLQTLADHAEAGHGLNLTFFPLIDVARLLPGAAPRRLDQAHWAQSTAPEIELLERDARLRGYHGFVRVVSTTDDDDLVSVRVRAPANFPLSPDVELISSEETAPLPVQFERAASHAVAGGPLTIADDLLVQPFELTLGIPAAWPDDRYQAAVVAILTRFIIRYRALQAYGQHL